MIGTITTATAADFQNHVGEYLNMVADGKEVIVTRDGEMLGRFVPKNRVITFLTDHLSGALKSKADAGTAREETLKEKYEIAD